MNKYYYALIGFIIVFIAGLVLFLNYNNSSTNDPSENEFVNKSEQELRDEVATATPSVLDTKLIIGNPNASVVIVEYFDYKCPNCNDFHRETATELESVYSDNEIYFELRTTPIIGPDSARAARGAYCAAEQNAFSEYHDAVMTYIWDNFYSNGNLAAEFEDIITIQVIEQLAQPLGINTEELTNCIESLKYNAALDRDLLAAADDGVRGTPGFTIGEQSFVGNQPLSVFEALIDAQL